MDTLFQAVDRCLMEESIPSTLLQSYLDQGRFNAYPFELLQRLQYTEQSPLHHPEGNVWNHTILVVDHAAQRKEQSTDARAFMWAALLHDIGKPAATKMRKGRITAYDHDKIGASLAEEFLSVFMSDKAWISYVAGLIRYHMQPLFVTKQLPFQDIDGMRKHVSIHDIALLGLCDRLGRTGSHAASEEQAMANFIKLCSTSAPSQPTANN